MKTLLSLGVISLLSICIANAEEMMVQAGHIDCAFKHTYSSPPDSTPSTLRCTSNNFDSPFGAPPKELILLNLKAFTTLGAKAQWPAPAPVITADENGIIVTVLHHDRVPDGNITRVTGDYVVSGSRPEAKYSGTVTPKRSR